MVVVAEAAAAAAAVDTARDLTATDRTVVVVVVIGIMTDREVDRVLMAADTAVTTTHPLQLLPPPHLHPLAKEARPVQTMIMLLSTPNTTVAKTRMLRTAVTLRK